MVGMVYDKMGTGSRWRCYGQAAFARDARRDRAGEIYEKTRNDWSSGGIRANRLRVGKSHQCLSDGISSAAVLEWTGHASACCGITDCSAGGRTRPADDAVASDARALRGKDQKGDRGIGSHYDSAHLSSDDHSGRRDQRLEP